MTGVYEVNVVSEVTDWAGEVLSLFGRMTGDSGPAGPPPLPTACAGDADDEGNLLAGLLLACGVDLVNEGSPYRVAERLKPRAMIRAEQEVSEIGNALAAARRRLMALAAEGRGPIVLPEQLKLYADLNAYCGPGEALVDPVELPDKWHRLRDLLPKSQLMNERWLCVGQWRSDLWHRRCPPGPITLESVRERTLRLRQGLDG